MTTREKIRLSALQLFDEKGLEATTVADICAAAKVSNGSFFHAFPNRESLFADLYLTALEQYHNAMVTVLVSNPNAGQGITALVRAHLGWVVDNKPQARFLFEQSKAEWMTTIREEQSAGNKYFGEIIEKWRLPLIGSGALIDMPISLFVSQIIGPAQIICRGWLSGRADNDPREFADDLIACACRALISSEAS